jgi:hypothetical protein
MPQMDKRLVIASPKTTPAGSIIFLRDRPQYQDWTSPILNSPAKDPGSPTVSEAFISLLPYLLISQDKEISWSCSAPVLDASLRQMILHGD